MTVDILKLAKKSGLNLIEETAVSNESGMDFQGVFAEDESGELWVLRKPRRPDVIQRGANEGKVLKLVQKHLLVNVPEWKINTPELIAYPMVPGIQTGSIDMNIRNYVWNINIENLSSSFVQSLAEVMASLHNIDQFEAAKCGVEVLSPDQVRQSLIERMDKVKKEIGTADELWKRWQHWLSDDSFWPGHSSFIHGDLHPPHILIDKEERVCRILDWTEAKVTDPGKDFVLFATVFGEKDLGCLLREYEKSGGKVWPKMKEHIIEFKAAYGIDIAEFALTTGANEHYLMAKKALGL
jgi:macrolide phosphotransferase